MRVLFVASECYPYVKTGGLADVVGALPLALRQRGLDVRVLLPGAPGVLDRLTGWTNLRRLPALPTPADKGTTRLLAAVGNDGVPLYIVDAPHWFDRPGNPYLGPDGLDWPDNALRYGALCQAAAVIAQEGAPEIHAEPWRPDVIHGHDWQAGLVPVYLNRMSEKSADRAGSRRRPGTVFTLHNLAFQGLFPAEILPQLGLPSTLMTIEGLEFYGQAGFLKAGLQWSDRLTTVSPTHAAEIRGPVWGFGLDGLLNKRADCLTGILNGIDTATWNPETDSVIAAPYSAATLEGKAVNKADLQAAFSLDIDHKAPLFAVVSRLTEQKGIDLIVAILPRLIEQRGQLAVLGTGDSTLETDLRQAVADHPGRCGIRLTYDEGLAHRLQAGADVLMVPSRFEPCGLTQMCALRYGTLPLVTQVGGLADTVTDATKANLAAGTATGFIAAQARISDLLGALGQVFSLWSQQDLWQQMQRTAMGRDVGWNHSAARYHDLYQSLLT